MTLLPELGKYPEFILAAYGASLIVLAGLAAWIRHDARTQARLLTELEAKGARRRSAQSDTARNRKPSRK